MTLVVTAGDLRIGQGYVRCGRCSNVFNALVGLSEERQAALIGQAPAPGPSAEGEPIALEAPLDAPENGDADAVPDSALEFNADSTELSEVFVEPRPGPHDIASGTFETIVLEADDLLAQTSESASIAESAAGVDTLTTAQDAANDGDAAAMAAANDASLDEPPTHEIPAGFDRSRIEAPRPRA
ncbi:MAG: MJ0042-type zinc finger domain-containing protein, partial [Steroidobacteraceae bacterium]